MNIIAHLFRGFRNVSIRWKSIAVFASLLFVVLALGTLSIVRLGMVKEAGETISASWMPGVQRAGEIAEAMNGYRHAESALVMSPDDDTMAETTKNLALALSQIQAARDKLAKLPTAPEEADYITKFVSAWESYLDLSKRIVGLVGNKKVADAADLLTGDSAYQFSKAKAFIARLLIAKVRGGDEAVARSNVVYRATIPIMLSAIVVVVVLCLSAAAFVVLGVARPLNRMTAVVGQMAGGQLDIVDDDMPGLGRGDEFGALAKALAVLRDSARERVRLEREAAETRAAADLRQAEMERHTQDFGMSVSGVMVMLSDAADGIRRSAETMTGTAESTRTQADTTTSGSIEAAQGLASVAAAAEEMAVTATEIGRRISDVAASTNAAVEAAGRSEQIVAALVGAVAEIGSVVQLISDIAGQTNLLALNATIEAARAGDAGKGFAVVASEVKSLASQTAKATEEIRAQIGDIQGATGQTVEAIRTIGATIRQMSKIATSIASAVEEQGAATREIATNVHQAAQGTNNIATNIEGVSRAASDTGAAASQVLSAAGELSKQSETLRRDVDDFLATVRAA